MHRFIKRMEVAVRHPYLELVVGVILIGTGVSEASGTIVEDISSGNLGVHHGVIALGFAHTMKALPSLLAVFILFDDADREAQ